MTPATEVTLQASRPSTAVEERGDPMQRQPSCCDFCGSLETLLEYLVGDEPIKWFVCSECARFIEIKDWDRLIERSLGACAEVRWIPEGEEPIVRKQVEDLVSAFRAFHLVAA